MEVSNWYRIMAGSCLLAAGQVEAACLTYESALTGARLDCKGRNRETAPNPEERRSQTAPIPDGANPRRRQSQRPQLPRAKERAPYSSSGISRRSGLALFGIGALRDRRSSEFCAVRPLRRLTDGLERDDADLFRAGPRPIEHKRANSRLLLISPSDVMYRTSRRLGAEHRDRPSAPATRDLRAE
jgi:hypothetical protein